MSSSRSFCLGIRSFFLILALTLPMAAVAQFMGPSASGAPTNAADAAEARIGTYITIEGSLVSHLREDYFQFRDDSGEIRVEIGPGVFGGRPVTPENRVRLVGEVDRTLAGTRYVWVKSLEILE